MQAVTRVHKKKRNHFGIGMTLKQRQYNSAAGAAAMVGDGDGGGDPKIGALPASKIFVWWFPK